MLKIGPDGPFSTEISRTRRDPGRANRQTASVTAEENEGAKKIRDTVRTDRHRADEKDALKQLRVDSRLDFLGRLLLALQRTVTISTASPAPHEHR